MLAPRPVRAWLTTVFVLIVVMTAIGGTTRLTGSGLSMVEWRPLMGALPPLSEAAWLETFARYQESPQYQQVNHWMTLADFQRIFFWEYVHRLMGRVVGVVVLLPWVVFLARGMLPHPLAWRTLGLFALGGVQGLMGWFMVRSGLVDVPRVSHLRLAAHLLLAFAIGAAVLWVRLSLEPPAPSARAVGRAGRVGLGVLAAALVVQSAWGAFMAGLHAGWFASTFPDVNGSWLPTAFIGDAPLLESLIHNPAAVHATHRLLAWGVLALALALSVLLLRDGAPQVRRLALAIAATTLLQIALGAAVVVLSVPTSLAVAHQVLALLLLALVAATLQRSMPRRSSPQRAATQQIAS